MRAPGVWVGLLVTTACGGGAPTPTRAADARASSCGSPANDSARAVCAALDTARALSGLPARVVRFSRVAGHTCVVTMPAAPEVLDGMGAVVVGDGGRVVSAVVSDSAACAVSAGLR